MKNLKELADIGAAAAFQELKECTRPNWCMWVNKTSAGDSWNDEEPARQAFAAAVRDAVLADMFPKLASGTSVKTVPLTMDDIHPPNQAPAVEAAGICTDCGGEVTHREGKHGEFDHKCDTEKPEPKPTTFEAREATA